MIGREGDGERQTGRQAGRQAGKLTRVIVIEKCHDALAPWLWPVVGLLLELLWCMISTDNQAHRPNMRLPHAILHNKERHWSHTRVLNTPKIPVDLLSESVCIPSKNKIAELTGVILVFSDFCNRPRFLSTPILASPH